MAEFFTEDGRIVTPEFDVMQTCIDDKEAGIAFMLDAENQFVGEDGIWYQILWERTCYPVSMIVSGKDPDLAKLMNQIYAETYKRESEVQFNKANQSNKMTPILWIVSIVVSAFIIVAGLRYLG
jgi:hypothetical protein